MRRWHFKTAIFWFLISSWGTHLRNFFYLSNLLQMPNSIEWSTLSSWATSRVAMRISFDDCSQFNSVTQLCPTLCDPMDCSMPCLPVHHGLPQFIQIHVHWVGNAIEPSHPLLSLLLPPSIFPSIRVFSISLCIRWPKYWSFSFSISPSSEYSGMISFRIDNFDLVAVQGTLKSLLQHHSSKESIFSVQLSLWSNSHIHTWLLNHSLTRWTFVGNVTAF